MPGAPVNTPEFLDLVRKSGVVDEKRLDGHIENLKGAGLLPPEASKAAGVLIRDGFLTHFQADNILQGKWRRFTIGKYKVLEKIGSGGMGQVYLCEHKLMRRRVAVKVLPTARAADDAARERFYREARVVAAVDHPNLVHAYDIDQDDNLHFLVMEYVDGASFQDIVKKVGPLDLTRACHYLRQAALGLQHAHEAGLVHRDIKPGNIMLDRSGVVKILDMGLARFFHDEDDMLTKKYDDNNMGTLDYQAPEQAIDSHGADIRADIYGLGATFFFMLTGKTPFGEGTMAQKAMWHQTRQPRRLADYRPDASPAIQELLDKMMAKEPDQRFAVPAQVAEALLPFTRTAIGQPPESEMPRLSLAASSAGSQEANTNAAVTKISPGSQVGKTAANVTSASRPSPANPPSPKSGSQSPLPARPPAMKATPSPGLGPTRAVALENTAPRAAAPPPPDDTVNAPWENFASETQDPAAKDDTAPQTVRTPRPAKGEQLARHKEKVRLGIVVGVLTVGLLAIVAILLAKFVLNDPGVGHVGGRAPLAVSKDGSKAFKTIRQALQSARAGDVIEIHDVVHEESLVVDQRGAEVTLQAAPGTNVRWVPGIKDEKTPLIHISKAPGFRLKGKGITLDGMIDAAHKVRSLVFITLASPGLTVEDVQFINIGQNAVKVMNAQGTKEQFIRLVNLGVPAEVASKGIVGVAFDANPDTLPPINDYIETDEFKGVAIPYHLKDNTVVGKHVIVPNER
jgi:serine/threonine protein kinase